MIFNQTGEYAMRAMAALACSESGDAITVTDLARCTGIPTAYLSKIMRQLVARGLVLSQKGHGGGFKLARPPGQIRFFEVLDTFDCISPEDRCAFGWGKCSAIAPCPLHPTWSRLKSTFHQWAETSTFADLQPIDLPMTMLAAGRARPAVRPAKSSSAGRPASADKKARKKSKPR